MADTYSTRGGTSGTSMDSGSIEVDFSSAEEAAAAYYGEEVNNDDETPGPGDSGQWGEMDSIETDWLAGWTLAFQPHLEEDGRRRHFVIRVVEGEGLQALTIPSGKAETYAQDTPLAEMPHTEREDEAREAYQNWVDENDPAPEDGGAWGEWQQIDEAPPWWIWGRDHTEEDRAQFLVAGELPDGTPVYLNGSGEIVESPVVFTSMDEVGAALEAYFTRVQNGEVPEDQRPTGSSPSPSRIESDAAAAGANEDGGATGLEGLLEDVDQSTIALGVAALGIGYVAVQAGGNS